MTASSRKLEHLNSQHSQIIAEIDQIKVEATIAQPWLSSVIADFNEYLEARRAEELASKKRPAISASEELKRIAREKRNMEVSWRQVKYTLDYYENMFPWLQELMGQVWWEIDKELVHEKNKEDGARDYLSDVEYSKMEPSKKFQLALERYNKSRKSPWQIGRHYERYIGYLYENDGYKVIFFGAEKRKEDLGRDLIATKGKKTHIIQCKCWAKEKTIHEKHVYQLFGTSLDYGIENANNDLFAKDYFYLLRNINQVLVVTCNISERAKIAASALGVDIRENDLLPEIWPQIKCNISARNGEKIYHLPFDQQYDKITIGDQPGEFYAQTCMEAEAKGFRRAFRWHGE